MNAFEGLERNLAGKSYQRLELWADHRNGHSDSIDIATIGVPTYIRLGETMLKMEVAVTEDELKSTLFSLFSKSSSRAPSGVLIPDRTVEIPAEAGDEIFIGREAAQQPDWVAIPNDASVSKRHTIVLPSADISTIKDWGNPCEDHANGTIVYVHPLAKY